MNDPEYKSKYGLYEYEIYNRILIIILNVTLNENNSKLNKDISYITGSKVYGPVFITTSKKPDFTEYTPYVSLTIDQYKKILDIRSKNHETTQNFVNSEKIYINFENILNLEQKKFINYEKQNISNFNTILNQTSYNK